eukprot:gnl/TRDRNA2_/TRDRNA2_131311_c0_seq2.p1 gnl/TRDRNA2_/TRDRNA2_131311_c0~~gnl/TRDRNA2_/TRDRNA2_131311_c0_seq2.p1  ORF type:complete len:468 (-),score=52.52 gnl/TRDRNA2_/TRDRNA2_131311_c0_seq2:299-1702(-)
MGCLSSPTMLALTASLWVVCTATPIRLTGGYEKGDLVVSKIRFSNEHGSIDVGDIGYVAGHATVDRNIRIMVHFPKSRSLNVALTEITREGIVFQCTEKGRCDIRTKASLYNGIAQDSVDRVALWFRPLLNFLLGVLGVVVLLTVGATVGVKLSRRLLDWTPSEEYVCGFCGGVLCDPVTLQQCGHSICQWCMQKWIASRTSFQEFRCPAGNCPASRELPPISYQLKAVVEERYPKLVAQQRRRFEQEQLEEAFGLATSTLCGLIEKAFKNKEGLNTVKVRELLEKGADFSSRGFHYSDDSILLILLNSSHLTSDIVLEAARLLVEAGATLGEDELRSLSTWWSSAEEPEPWQKLAQQQAGLDRAQWFTWCLSRLFEAVFQNKVSLRVKLVQECIEHGADVNSKSIKYTQDSFLLVLLNSSHLTSEIVLEATQLLVDAGATLGEREHRSLLNRFAAEAIAALQASVG